MFPDFSTLKLYNSNLLDVSELDELLLVVNVLCEEIKITGYSYKYFIDSTVLPEPDR